MHEENFNKLKDYALKLLSFRPRSVNEIKIKLNYYCQKNKLSLDLPAKVIRNLSDQNLLNDDKFSEWWIDQRQTFRPKGKFVLRSELVAKGVDREIIDKKLDSAQNKKLELESAEKIIQKKMRLYKNLPTRELKRKLADHLLRRGFSFEVARQVIDSLIQKE